MAAIIDALGVEIEKQGADIGSLGDTFLTRTIDESIARVVSNDAMLVRLGPTVALAAAAVPLVADVVATLPGVPDDMTLPTALERLGVTEQLEAADAQWRYPDPVRESLLRSIDTTHDNDLRCARAAFVEYWLDHDCPHNALAIAIEGEDWHTVLDVVSEHWTTLYTSGFLSSIDEALIERIPEHVAQGHPTVDAIRRMHRRFATPREIPVVATTQSAPPEDTAGPAEVMMRVITLRIEGALLDAAALCEDLAAAPVPAFAELDERTRHAYAFLYLHIGITYQLVDRADEATTMFRRAHRAGAGMFVERDAAGKLALMYAVRGACFDAQRWLDEEQRHPPLPSKESERLVRTAGMVAAALIAVDRLEPESALAMLTDLGSPTDREEYWAHVLYAVGQHALLAGIPAEGLRRIVHHLEHYPELHGEGSAAGPMLDAVRANLYLAIGEIDSARNLVGQSHHPQTVAVRARMHLLAGEAGDAESLADQYWTDVRCSAREAVELSVIGAVAADMNGDRKSALQHLGRAVALSRQHGLQLPFALLEPSMVRRLATLGAPLPVKADRVADDLAVFRPILPAVRLTKQETIVLTALANGGTIAEIAKRRFVSPHTIKSHTMSVYRKLGAHSRKEAISRAVRLGLLVDRDS
ncbi:LuxR C-terminal-related transcriptional regulator [Rhodococcus sp. (in: high G+C Gram-positive bacteria)]|uniref:LuxR C-terminal-related transcriptional regulator n=1 Tax=Rhodococcus sp. TaxID=1831 RepID=UPI003B8A9208